MASNVPALFAASLVIDQRKAAEAQLEGLSVQKGFIPHLLQIVLDRTQALPVRQAACLYFKNQIKQRWDDVSPGLLVSQNCPYSNLDARIATGGVPNHVSGQDDNSRKLGSKYGEFIPTPG